MRRVSSFVRTRVAPAEASFPLISTSGGFPGEKNRSLIFGEVLSIAASSSGVDIGEAAAVVAAVRGAEAAIFGRPFVGEDIEAVASFSKRLRIRNSEGSCLRHSATLRPTLRLHTESRVRKITEDTLFKAARARGYLSCRLNNLGIVSLKLRWQDLMQVRSFGGTIASEDRARVDRASGLTRMHTTSRTAIQGSHGQLDHLN